MSSTRSITGCFACKTKRKKCDETKPQCLRCQKSRTECPGYTYVQDPDKPNRKPRTISAPRTWVGQSRRKTTGAEHGNSSANAIEPNPQPHDQLPLDYDLVASANFQPSSEANDMPNAWASSVPFHGLDQYSSVGFNAPYPGLNGNPLNMGGAPPMHYGQVTHLGGFFNLDQPLDVDPPWQYPQPYAGTGLTPVLSAPWALGWSPFDTEGLDDATDGDDEDEKGIISEIYHQPVLDKTLESNALPFVLQNYITWARRMTFEPVKVTAIARDFVLGHFKDGEHTRWIIVLLANIGSKIGGIQPLEGELSPMISALQSAVRRRLRAIKSHPNPTRPELAKALNSAVETIFINFYIGPLSAALILRQEAASIFRQLCPGNLNTPIDLHALLQHPLGCLQHFAHIDILSGALSDTSTLFQYDVSIPGIHFTNSSVAVPRTQGDGVVQWVHAVPDQMILILAKLQSVRQSGLTPNEDMISSFERDIQETKPFEGSLSDSFLVLMRLIVQEAWRQVVFVYLYMAVCGDPCDTLRVKSAFQRYIRILNGTVPGRLPDELGLTVLLMSTAAHQEHDRETIRKRLIGTHTSVRTFGTNDHAMRIIEDFWTRSDTEGRPTMWSDISVSRKRVLGI